MHFVTQSIYFSAARNKAVGNIFSGSNTRLTEQNFLLLFSIEEFKCYQ